MGAVDEDWVRAHVASEITALEGRVSDAIVAAGTMFAAKVPGVQVVFGTVIDTAGLSVQVALDDGSGVAASTAVSPVSVDDRVAVLVCPPNGSLTLGPIG